MKNQKETNHENQKHGEFILIEREFSKLLYFYLNAAEKLLHFIFFIFQNFHV
jgi:hypothetical protein